MFCGTDVLFLRFVLVLGLCCVCFGLTFWDWFLGGWLIWFGFLFGLVGLGFDVVLGLGFGWMD